MANEKIVEKLERKLAQLRVGNLATVHIDEETIKEILNQFAIDDEDSAAYSKEEYYRGLQDGFLESERQKGRLAWTSALDNDPDINDEYLVLWNSNVFKGQLFYGICEWDGEEWCIEGMDQFRMYGERDMKIVYYMHLPEIPL